MVSNFRSVYLFRAHFEWKFWKNLRGLSLYLIYEFFNKFERITYDHIIIKLHWINHNIIGMSHKVWLHLCIILILSNLVMQVAIDLVTPQENAGSNGNFFLPPKEKA